MNSETWTTRPAYAPVYAPQTIVKTCRQVPYTAWERVRHCWRYLLHGERPPENKTITTYYICIAEHTSPATTRPSHRSRSPP